MLALPFVLAAVPLIFTLPGDPLFTFTLGSLPVTISQPGVERFLSIALKSWISVQAAIVLASTTSFPDLLTAMRSVEHSFPAGCDLRIDVALPVRPGR